MFKLWCVFLREDIVAKLSCTSAAAANADRNNSTATGAADDAENDETSHIVGTSVGRPATTTYQSTDTTYRPSRPIRIPAPSYY